MKDLVLDGYGKLVKVNLGGTGEMYALQYNGNNYLYKPALRKNTTIVEPFRGIVQECAYRVQDIVDSESAIWCRYIENESSCGALQLRIDVAPRSRNYYWFRDDDDFTPEEVNQFMREFVTDYLLYNYDAHGNNFITGKDGIIRGIDKEQSFRYINDPDSAKLSVDYAPNSVRYFEDEPIYNKIFKRYRDGKLDIDFNVISHYMDKVDCFDYDEYRNIFVPYCKACQASFGADSQAMLDKIVERKVNMRSNVEAFFQQLTEERENSLGGRKR